MVSSDTNQLKAAISWSEYKSDFLSGVNTGLEKQKSVKTRPCLISVANQWLVFFGLTARGERAAAWRGGGGAREPVVAPRCQNVKNRFSLRAKQKNTHARVKIPKSYNHPKYEAPEKTIHEKRTIFIEKIEEK